MPSKRFLNIIERILFRGYSVASRFNQINFTGDYSTAVCFTADSKHLLCYLKDSNKIVAYKLLSKVYKYISHHPRIYNTLYNAVFCLTKITERFQWEVISRGASI